MAEDVFDDLADWWLSMYAPSRELSKEAALGAALQELGILRQGYTILSRRIVRDWHQATEETYESIVAVDLEDEGRVHTVMIAAYAVITPPPVPIERVAEVWRERAKRLTNAGVNIPHWHLVWEGTIYTNYPAHDLVQYLAEYDLDDTSMRELATSLARIFLGLARLSLRPLGLAHSLRTDSFKVYYCGFGFNVGESESESTEALVQEYESSVLPRLPQRFREKYFAVTKSDSL